VAAEANDLHEPQRIAVRSLTDYLGIDPSERW